MTEPPVSQPVKVPHVERLQIAVSDKLRVTAEGRLSILVAAVVVVLLGYMWLHELEASEQRLGANVPSGRLLLS